MKTMLRAVAVAGLAAILAVPASAVAAARGATIKGTIRAGQAPGRPTANAAVAIEGPSVPAAAGAPHVVMDQRNDTFVPHVLAVAAGTTVDFPNSDRWLHNVFSTSAAKKFDLSMYGKDEVKSVVFDTPGLVEVRCNVHPRMKAFILVNANPYVAVSDEQGSYTIANVPPGTYKLRVWHEDQIEQQISVTVGEGEVRSVDVRLEKRRD